MRVPGPPRYAPTVTSGLKFAVVREDPRLEARLIQRSNAKQVLLVASGGCTALTLEALHPKLEITAFDLNPHQLAHLAAKRAAARRGDHRALNVGHDDPRALNQRGAFEGLFRILRGALTELVTSAEELEAFFGAPTPIRLDLLDRWRSSPYWPAVFATAFNEPLLHAMFGPAATQHAAPGSYPSYFQRVFERGLARDDAAHNPFLQHLLLGAYRPADAPEYTRRPLPEASRIEAVLGTLLDVPDLGRFQLFSLSNVFDWSSDAEIVAWTARLQREARPGSAVLIRQLNNQRELARHLAPAFEVDHALGAELLAEDRSLFYERVVVALRRA